MSAQPPELQYQQSPPRRFHKLGRRIAIVIALLIGLAAATPMLLRELERMRLARLYDRCCRTPPVDIAYTDGRTYLAPAWHDLNDGMNTTLSSLATVFLGKLRTPDGTREYLVGIDITTLKRGAPTIIYTRSRAMTRGGHFGGPRYGPATDEVVVLPSNALKRIVLHGGKVDPNDPSHFTIDYETSEHRGTIDGWMKANGTIALEPREPASTTAPSTTAPAPLSPATSR